MKSPLRRCQCGLLAGQAVVLQSAYISPTGHGIVLRAGLYLWMDLQRERIHLLLKQSEGYSGRLKSTLEPSISAVTLTASGGEGAVTFYSSDFSNKLIL